MHLLWLFFAWPAGAAWGNVAAIPLCAVIGSIGAWIFRDRIGRRLAAWWNRHHAPHLRAELEAVHGHLCNDLDAHKEAITGLLAAHHDALKAHVDTALGAHQEKVVSSLVNVIPPAQPPQRGKK